MSRQKSHISKEPDLTEALKRLRGRMGISQEGLARRIGVTVRTVSRWEHGDRIPTSQIALFGEFSAIVQDAKLYRLFHTTVIKRVNLNPGISDFIPTTVDEMIAAREFLKSLRDKSAVQRQSV